MSKSYLITLTPTGRFFFGGDMTFTVNGKETEYTSYIIRSNKFPQQTSLLGMLRFLILRNDNSVFDVNTQSITNRDDASRLIGPRSFVASGKRGDFGMILDISPCFIQGNHNGKWMDLTLKSKEEPMDVDCSKYVQAVINGKLVEVPSMNYDVKKHYEPEYGETKESEIFQEDVCNGINRDITTGQTEDNALFKQISYRLKEGFRFAFYAKVDMDGFSQYSGQTVQVGGDNSQFVIGIEECTIPQPSEKKGKCVALVSPAYLTSDDLADVRYAITETIPFKCIKTETQSVQSYNKRNQMYDYTEALSLYDKGSVFYFEDEYKAKSFTQILESHADFYQIGYNHYQVK